MQSLRPENCLQEYYLSVEGRSCPCCGQRFWNLGGMRLSIPWRRRLFALGCGVIRKFFCSYNVYNPWCHQNVLPIWTSSTSTWRSRKSSTWTCFCWIKHLDQLVKDAARLYRDGRQRYCDISVYRRSSTTILFDSTWSDQVWIKVGPNILWNSLRLRSSHHGRDKGTCRGRMHWWGLTRDDPWRGVGSYEPQTRSLQCYV